MSPSSPCQPTRSKCCISGVSSLELNFWLKLEFVVCLICGLGSLVVCHTYMEACAVIPHVSKGKINKSKINHPLCTVATALSAYGTSVLFCLLWFYSTRIYQQLAGLHTQLRIHWLVLNSTPCHWPLHSFYGGGILLTQEDVFFPQKLLS